MAERENMLLYGSEKQFGIYQITARDPEHDYRFMGLDYVEKKGITVTRADYDLIYTAPLTEKDTLDGIYERFNIQRPADFTGHSLSVSDVVVLNDGSTVKAYYVDSIGFAELPEFFKERNMDLQKENLLNEELQEIEIFDKPGLFSNGRLRDEDMPEGLYRYDLRGSDYDPGQPITVEKTVVVNHAASVLMAEELDLGTDGRLELGEDGLNFTGAELTVREFMEEQQQKRNGLIHGDSDHIAVEGHLGTWYAVDETEIGGEKFFLLEHEEHGDMHYPVFCYNGQFRRGADGTPLTYMLHGHIHKSEDQVLVDRFSTETRAMMRKSAHQETAQPVPCQMINCFCMYSDYTPLTLEEWVECDQRRRDKADR